MNNNEQSCQTVSSTLGSGYPATDLSLSDSLTKAAWYRWLIFAVLSGGYILVYFHRLCPAVVAVDMMADLQAGGALLGLLGSAYFYPYALMQLPAGLLADSWGPRRTIALFSLLAACGSFILGLAPSIEMAILGRTLVGLGVSMLFVPTMKILTEWFKPREFARMTGILLAMGGAGSLIATTPLALLTDQFGWRFAFIVVGVLTLLLAVLVWSIVRDRPSDMVWDSPLTKKTAHPELNVRQGLCQILSNRHFWPLAAWFFFQSALFFSFAGLWGGPFLQHIYGLDRAQTGQILSFLAIGLMFGSPLQTWLSNRLFNGRKPALILASTVSSGIALMLTTQTGNMSLPTLYILCLLMGAFTSASVVIGFSAAKELFPTQISGTAIGLINLFPFAGGAVFQPFIGMILEHHGKIDGAYTLNGYQQSFVALLICALISFVASLLTKETFGESSTK